MRIEQIETVKIQGQDYLLNGTMLVPKADGNKEYELIKLWIEEGNTPEAEFSDEELTAQELNEKISYARQYLAETDWVKDYKLRHDLGLEIISESSSKWIILKNRSEYIKFLKGVE